MSSSGSDVECRIMPNGNGHWYWEIITDRNDVLRRGVSDTEDAAHQDAETARSLITGEGLHPRGSNAGQPWIEHLQISVEEVRTATRQHTHATAARIERARRLLATSALMMMRTQILVGASKAADQEGAS